MTSFFFSVLLNSFLTGYKGVRLQAIEKQELKQICSVITSAALIKHEKSCNCPSYYHMKSRVTLRPTITHKKCVFFRPTIKHETHVTDLTQ